MGWLKRERLAARLIGIFGFTDVQRSLDGVQYLYNEGPNTFAFVGAKPTRGVFQTDGWGEVNVAVAYAAFTRQWIRGAYTSETRAFGIYYDDWRPILKTDNRPLASKTLIISESSPSAATTSAHYVPAGGRSMCCLGCRADGGLGPADTALLRV